jgi:predicted dehydrogenase
MATEKSVAVGVVGTSWWADAMHLPALNDHPHGTVTAICGRNEANARTIAERWQIPNVFTDYNQMIDSGLINAVVVSTPDDSHYPITMKALDAGLHVLCEKPLGLKYAEAKEMADTAQQKGVKHMVPFTYSFMPTARYMKELVDTGYIGKPYHLNMRYYTGYGRRPGYQWRFDLRRVSAGDMANIGSHFLYIARWLFGEIVSISATLGHLIDRPAFDPQGEPYAVGEDMAILACQFASGAYANIHVTSVCYEDTPFGQTHHMELHGSDGTLYSFTDWDKIQRVSGARVGEGMVKELPIPDHIWGGVRRDTVHNTYRDLFRKEDLMTRQFITGIAEDKPLKPDFADGARIQQIVDAGKLSHTERRWIDVDSIT